ncbi:MAG TPA: ATP-binding protein [Tahibacter sp.]|uniref:ATP-binding protein n=1 Tax=Tahibacter sp. TaxID=2056211 RepID=UPI002C6822FF|nr:ATP-binding protein [Tahibacter sp.]HSX61235.1 ATP-binding protein [Tahibacter sp.]
MLDAPREALQTGETLLSRGGLDAAQRETLLRDMATAALLLSAGDAARVADSLDALGRDSGRVSASAMADIVRARIRLDGEQIESGLALAGSATAALRTIGDPYWDAVADIETCELLLTTSRAQTAQPHCERALAEFARRGDNYAIARAENLLQWVYGALGDPARALPLARAAHARYSRLGSRGGMAMMDDNSASLYLSLGQPATALAASRRALAFELAHDKIAHSISSRRNIAAALAALKQPQEALAVLEVALADARRLELGRLTAQLLSTQAEVAEKAGRLDLALNATRALVELNARLSSRDVARAVAELDARYDAQTREAEIRALRQSGELQSALLRAAEADKAGEGARARLYAFVLIASLSVGALLATIIALRLRWLRQLNGALSQVNRTRADMLAMAAHEVRNPMAAISGLIDMALQRVDDRRARALLETARSTSAELVRTAEDYLDHAQLALERVDLRDEPFDLPALLSHVAGLYRAELAGRPIRLSQRFDPALPTRVCGDAARLQQILVNLLGNAVKFTTAGDIALVADAVDGERVRFRIIDSGPGMADGELRRLLQPFERGGGRTRRGAGLGLSIANQLIGIMGGELEIDTRLGIGSEFSFCLALPAAPPEPEAEPAVRPRGRVLLVDDDAAIRELLSAQLDALGVEHRVAAGIAEALAVWRDFAPDTLLVDLHLDGENGIDLIRRVRTECAPAPPPRCLIHSASPPDGPHDRPPAEWQIEWVRKPMPLRDLGRLLGDEPAPATMPPAGGIAPSVAVAATAA